MDALILAAGLGTRLRPLTDDRPKALVTVGGPTMLERTARRLVGAGADRLIINTHPFAEQVEALVCEKEGFGAEVCLSREAEGPLGTGGGLKRAAPFFRKDAPFFLHNVDVFTDLDLAALYDAHLHAEALATLAVRPARTRRHLAFDARGLCGYGHPEDGCEVLVRPPEGPARRVDFCGVQVLSPRVFDLMTEEGVFSIISVYLRLAQEGERIAASDVGDETTWIDIGTPERLEEARRSLLLH